MRGRSQEIDILKGLLTLGMVFAHCVQFLDASAHPLLKAASLLGNLVSFSGFLFCFGFANWSAYLSRPAIPWSRVMTTALKCYLAFAISGIAYLLLASGEAARADWLWRVAALRLIPGYSEFLVAFALITLLSCTFAPFVRFTTRRATGVTAFSVLVLLLAQCVPETAAFDPALGLLVGGTGFAYFPVILYSPLFVIGVWVARHRHGYHALAMATAVAGAIGFAVLTSVDFPMNRFPPGAVWIVCSAALVYLYYEAARFITDRFPGWIKLYLTAVGQNALVYLLVTNLALFTSAALGRRHGFSAGETVVAFGLLMGLIGFLQFIQAHPGRSANPTQGRLRGA